MRISDWSSDVCSSDLRDRLDGLDTALAAINALPLDAVSAHTGIDQTAIAGIAKALHDAPTAAVYGRMGLSTQRFGSLCQWLIQLINVYTGNLDREGGTLINDAAMPITGPGTAGGHYARDRKSTRLKPEFAGDRKSTRLNSSH